MRYRKGEIKPEDKIGWKLQSTPPPGPMRFVITISNLTRTEADRVALLLLDLQRERIGKPY